MILIYLSLYIKNPCSIIECGEDVLRFVSYCVFINYSVGHITQRSLIQWMVCERSILSWQLSKALHLDSIICEQAMEWIEYGSKVQLCQSLGCRVKCILLQWQQHKKTCSTSGNNVYIYEFLPGVGNRIHFVNLQCNRVMLIDTWWSTLTNFAICRINVLYFTLKAITKNSIIIKAARMEDSHPPVHHKSSEITVMYCYILIKIQIFIHEIKVGNIICNMSAILTLC